MHRPSRTALDDGPAYVPRPKVEPVPLYGPEFERDPHALYQRLRSEIGPVVPVLLEPRVPAWLVLDYALISEVATDERRFSKDSRLWRDRAEGLVPDTSGVLPMMEYRPNVLFADGAEHGQLRRAVAASLEKAAGDQLSRSIDAVAHRLIDQFAEAGTADLMAQYAMPLPLLVLNRAFGLADSEGERLVAIIGRIWAGNGDDAVRAGKEYEQYMAGLADAKWQQPGQDVPSYLIAEGFSFEQVVHHLVLLIGAGSAPTTGLLGNTLRILLTDTQLRREVAAAQLRVADVITQVLWRDPPIQNFAARYPRHDVLLNGIPLRAGDVIVFGLAAANHDPVVAAAGIPRGNRAHLAYSAGPHRCPAPTIAEGIVARAIDTLRDRLPDLRLAVPAEQLTWGPSAFARAPQSLPVRFSPVHRDTMGDRSWPSPSFSTPPQPTSPVSRPDSAGPARWSGLNFLARWWRGR